MIESQTKKTMRLIIMTQCAGMISLLLFNNGFILTYLSKLGIPSSRILFFLSLPYLISFLLTTPFAFISDRFGKKKVGTMGLIGTVIGLFLLTVAGNLPNQLTNWAVGAGITIFGIGFAIFMSGWFALLEPIVPPNIRGRFFGKLRLSWHLVGIVVTLVITRVLQTYSTPGVYQIILCVIILLSFVWIFSYAQIPEIDKSRPQNISLRKSFSHVVSIPGYMPFCSYVFLLTLFTGACHLIFGLLEKDVLNFSEYQIVMMGNLLFAGNLIGFYFGGRMIDRYGTKFVFLFCHLSFAVILFLFVGRSIFPLPVIVTVGFLSVCFGSARAATGIAVTTEMMALIPKENKSLSTSLNFTLIAAGTTLSGMISGKAVELNILNKSWKLFGLTMSEYDTLLLGCGIMVILLIVTLGLIPSVIKKAQWIPQRT
ncbi:MAG: MFS transporter [Desulfobacteraceae bacterium]|nr:MFS transporter [Desulfobacteraceae bacterium]